MSGGHWHCLPNRTAHGLVVEISASVKNPRFLCRQAILNYELKIVHNCLEQAVTSLMCQCKYINQFVLLQQKFAVASWMCSVLVIFHRYRSSEMTSSWKQPSSVKPGLRLNQINRRSNRIQINWGLLYFKLNDQFWKIDLIIFHFSCQEYHTMCFFASD